MGMLKRRIYPRDITINIGEGEDIPEHPYPGQKWKEVPSYCLFRPWLRERLFAFSYRTHHLVAEDHLLCCSAQLGSP